LLRVNKEAMKTIKIRPLQHNDFPQWLPLWDANNLGHRDEAVTTETWSRICDPAQSVCGLGAFDGSSLVGLTHYILHPTTGSLQPACYLQDVFTAPEHRRKGIARKLVGEVARIGRKEKWARLYWFAENDNESAQALYKNLGTKMDFTLFMMSVG